MTVTEKELYKLIAMLEKRITTLERSVKDLFKVVRIVTGTRITK